jgi:hypothetical protein
MDYNKESSGHSFHQWSEEILSGFAPWSLNIMENTWKQDLTEGSHYKVSFDASDIKLVILQLVQTCADNGANKFAHNVQSC